MGRGVPEFAATLAFVDVHLISVSGSRGESTGQVLKVRKCHNCGVSSSGMLDV